MPDPHLYHAMYTRHTALERPLPALPSPTLTNPDMVLPDELPVDLPALSSPVLPNAATAEWRRPPSPSYLQKQNGAGGAVGEIRQVGGSSRNMASTIHASRRSGSDISSSASSGGRTVTSERDGEGRLETSAGRKMRRPRIARGDTVSNHTPQAARVRYESAGLLPSSPTEPTLYHGSADAERRPGWNGSHGNTDTEEYSQPGHKLPRKAKKDEENDNGFESDGAGTQDGESVGAKVDETLDEQRRQQQQEEQASLLLSKRAEQILANAKKRLNLMEGNLRGARDLVAPLTAANLKRATSLGGGGSTTTASSGYRSRYGGGDDISPRYDPAFGGSGLRALRSLQSQSSSPSMHRDYHSSGHWRGYSATEIPERPYTSFNDHHYRSGSPSTPTAAARRIPIKPRDITSPSPTHLGGEGDGKATEPHLRGSKSYDSLGRLHARRSISRDPLYLRGSPDPGLGRVEEHDTPLTSSDLHATTTTTTTTSNIHAAHGAFPGHIPRRPASEASTRPYDPYSRPSSRSSDLRSQISSLQGKISTLKERAKEDSLRRRSMQSIREPSPLNNAVAAAPEFYYTPGVIQSAPNSRVKGTRERVGFVRDADIDRKPDPRRERLATEDAASRLVSAFNHLHQPPRQIGKSASAQNLRVGNGGSESMTATSYLSSALRSSPPSRAAATGRSSSIGPAIAPPRLQARQSSNTLPQSVSAPKPTSPSNPSPPPGPAVAHEDRADAFDYKHFFLHSQMRNSSHGFAERETASEIASEMTSEDGGEEEEVSSSTGTARAVTPTGTTTGAGAAQASDGDDELDEDDDDETEDERETRYGADEDGDGSNARDEADDLGTPFRLREIERTIAERRQSQSQSQHHVRTLSAESVSTMATFATADEEMDDDPLSSSPPHALGSPNTLLASTTPSGPHWPFPAPTTATRKTPSPPSTATTCPRIPGAGERSSPVASASPNSTIRPTSVDQNLTALPTHPSHHPSTSTIDATRATAAIISIQGKTTTASLSDSSSERADSGVGLPAKLQNPSPHRPSQNTTPISEKQSPPRPTSNLTTLPSSPTRPPLPNEKVQGKGISFAALQSFSPSSPPASPHQSPNKGATTLLSPPRDPASIIVDALLDSSLHPTTSTSSSVPSSPTSTFGTAGNKALGLRDKALLFALVDGLRKAVGTLQVSSGEGAGDGAGKEEEEALAALIRGRLEVARGVLEGGIGEGE